MKSITLVLTTLLAVAHVSAQPLRPKEADTSEIAQQAIAAYRKGDLPAALALATKLTEAAPKQPSGWFLRAQLHVTQRQHAQAVADYSEVIKLDPKSPNAWEARGEAYFKLGKIAESIADFDQFLERVPAQRPHHWQRGIALYYAGRFKDGKEQFEIHQTVNSNDVENAVWHFLCAARADGLAAAKKNLIPIEGDSRVPMAQVHQLFAGKAKPEDVLAAAKAAPAETRSGEPLFYAHLYLGIYYEALGDAKQARDYIFKAAERADQNGYMGDVARVHAEILRKQEKK
ncbi:MAG: tetratricopeptide repeat protein [Proteobacteria bacterium]|nr:tetratricopeptide repeat protein [Verrucomicrobiota bacterium]NBU09421.1 tetratricopeptide repeat protein [Pseudomonadota bacterium]